MALKRPHAHLFVTEAQKQVFINECQTWSNLGLHPHIVTCHFVREISGVPSVFSEWMVGGSLADLLRADTLYAGAAQETGARILYIAIQAARGLGFAHENGVVHLDVKPHNFLFGKDGVVKVADFGIAQSLGGPVAHEQTELEGQAITERPQQQPRSAQGGGAYTPAYAAPEQEEGKTLTRRTDIFCWAVTVLEMYMAQRPWQLSKIAGFIMTETRGSARFAIPDRMFSLLGRCLAMDPEDRPHDFAEVEAELLEIYRQETGVVYPRNVPSDGSDSAGHLNNKALTLLELGEDGEALSCWMQSLELNFEALERREQGDSSAFLDCYFKAMGKRAGIDLDLCLSNLELFLLKRKTASKGGLNSRVEKMRYEFSRVGGGVR
ncbi:MAG TPA: hypothetical protein DEB24_06785 [Coriobacteriia bacterium]|nr:hypothetical protein [Coriobacteriia bacterium]